MNWIEVSIPFSGAETEIVSYNLQLVVDWNGLVEIPKKDGSVIYKIYFPDDQSLKDNFKKLRDSLKELASSGVSLDPEEMSWIVLGNEDWSENWKRFFVPLEIGDNIVVKPSWRDYTSAEGKIVVDIDPGMAFGVGSHYSTRMAIVLLEKYTPRMNSLLDLGCGTGILSIVARRLGIKHVYAIDNDILSISALKENLLLNGLEDKVEFFHQSGITGFPYQVDIIVANIVASVFKEIRKQFSHALSPDGIVILAGILEEEGVEIRSVFCEEGFRLLEELRDGEWVSFVFKKVRGEE